MYYYKGFDSNLQQHIEKTFENEDEAIDFARNNVFMYPKYSVEDEDGEIVDSHKIASDEEDAIMDSMFPDEDSMEGFDVDNFFDSE